MTTITSGLFAKRGPLTEAVRRNLAVRGAGIQLRDGWARYGWSGTEGCCGVVASVAPETGRIKGLRWATAGKVVKGSFKLKHLEDDNDDVEAVVEVDGADLVWPTAGERPRNFSNWLTLGNTQISFRESEGGTILTRDEIQERGIKDYYLRASLVLVGVDECHIMAHIIGGVASLEEMKKRAAEWGLVAGVDSANVPTVGVKVSGNLTRAPIKLMVTEPQDMGLGLGLLPMLEEVSGETAKVNRDELEKELSLFLRNWSPATNVKEWKAALGKATPPAAKEATILWPEYRGDSGLEDQQGNSQSVSVLKPRPVTTSKYGPGGEYHTDMLDGLEIPEGLRGTLVGAMNASVAKNTWRVYSSAYRNFCSTLLEYDIPPPSRILVRHLLIFTGHLLAEGKAASTIRSYLSGVRKVAEARGDNFSDEDLGLVKAALRGKANTEASRPFRQLMSVELMIHLKRGLAKARGPQWSQHNKRVLWLLATWLFWSSCRGGEMAMETETEFDPNNNLLWADVSPGEEGESVTLTLRSPKEVRGMRNIQVELFQVGGDLCPLAAWGKFEGENKLGRAEEMPVFRWDSGRNITLGRMNKILKEILHPVVDYREGQLGIHCFRNSVPSLMRELGYEDELIKAQGRWTSEAFRRYIKKTKKVRREEKRRLAGDINRVAGLV